jgi:hypothetical protein
MYLPDNYINDRLIITKSQQKIYKQNTGFEIENANVSDGGIGITSYNIGDLIVATEPTVLSTINAIASGNVLLSGGVGVIPYYGKVNLTSAVSGILPASNGGTGLSSYTIGDLLYASGTNVLNTLSDITTGNVLLSNGVGVAPSYGKVNLATTVSGTLPIANGGTNLTTYTIGDLLYASATNVLGRLADDVVDNVLLSKGFGVAPSYGKVNLTSMVSGTLPFANGGTNKSGSYAFGVVFSTGTAVSSVGSASATTICRVNSAATSFEFTTARRLFQTLSTSTSSMITCSTAIPDDNTIPQITEGDQILSLSITPTTSTSLIEIIIHANGTSGIGASMMTLFSDIASSNALQTTYFSSVSSSAVNANLYYNISSASTTTRTYSVRVGPASGTMYINGSGGNQRFNGTANTWMQIIETSST